MAPGTKVYVNYGWSSPRLPHSERPTDARFVFRHMPTHITHLRFDPPNKQGVEVDIRAIRFVTSDNYTPAPGKTVFEFSPGEWQSWSLESIVWQPEIGTFITTGGGPTLQTTLDLNLPASLQSDHALPVPILAAGFGLFLWMLCLLLLTIIVGAAAIKHRRDPAWAGLVVACGFAGWVLTILSSFPGFWSYDQYYSLNEVFAERVSDIHPPMFTQSWVFLINVASGLGFDALAQIASLLYVQATLFWSAAVALALALRPRWIGPTFLLTFALTPPILAYLGEIGKDGQMMQALFIAVVLLYLAARRQSAALLIISLLPLFYALTVRSNGPAAVLPLCFFWSAILLYLARGKRSDPKSTPLSLAKTWSERFAFLGIALALFGGLVGANAAFYSATVDSACCLRSPGYMTAVHDMMGISVRTDVNYMPSYLIEDPDYDIDKMREYYYPPDNLNFTGILGIYGEEERRKILRDWLRVVSANPIEYVQHRWDVLRYFLGLSNESVRYALFTGTYVAEFPWVTDRSRELMMGLGEVGRIATEIRSWFLKYFSFASNSWLFRPWAWIVVFASAFVFLGGRFRSIESQAAIYVGLSAALYFLPHILLTSSASFRYVIWPVLAVPLVVFLLFGETVSTAREDPTSGRNWWRKLVSPKGQIGARGGAIAQTIMGRQMDLVLFFAGSAIALLFGQALIWAFA